MSGYLHLRLHAAASGLQLTARGHLDARTSRQIGQAISMALHQLRARRLTLDLTAVDSIDAVGVGALIRSRVEADRCGVILTIADACPHLLDAMRLHARCSPPRASAGTATGLVAVLLTPWTRPRMLCTRQRRRRQPGPAH